MIADWGQTLVGIFNQALAAIQAAVETVVEVAADTYAWVSSRIAEILGPLIDSIAASLASEIASWISESLDRLEGYAGSSISVLDATILAALGRFAVVQDFFSPLLSAAHKADGLALAFMPLIGGPLGYARILRPHVSDVMGVPFKNDAPTLNVVGKAVTGGLSSSEVDVIRNSGLDLSSYGAFWNSAAGLVEGIVGMPLATSMAGVRFDRPTVEDPPNRYGLLIGGCPQSGDTDGLFWGHLKEAYDMLLDRGFEPGRVFLLTCVFNDRPEVDGWSSRNDPNIYDVADALNELNTMMQATQDNLLYVEIQAHGCSVVFPCGYDGFGVYPNNAAYNYADFATDLNAAVGFGATALYSSAVFVIQTSASGAAIPYLRSQGGNDDPARTIVTCARNDQTCYAMRFADIDIFLYHFLNRMDVDRQQAGEAGFFWGALGAFLYPFSVAIRCILGMEDLLGCIVGFGVLALYIVGTIITLGALFVAHLALTIVVGVIASLVNIIAVGWSPTRNGFASGPEMRVYDGFDYARGWTEWGLFGYGIAGTNPQIYNEELAREVELV